MRGATGVGLTLIGVIALIAAIRGTYRDVWAALWKDSATNTYKTDVPIKKIVDPWDSIVPAQSSPWDRIAQ